MTLIVEDGTGLIDAESYASVVEFKAYCYKRAMDYSLLTDEGIEVLLIKATDYMVNVYRNRWQGRRTNGTQSLDFPRYDVVVDGYSLLSNIVPPLVKNACIELAFKSDTVELLPDIERATVKEKVDVIEVEYDKFAPVQTRYTQIDAMLLPLLSAADSLSVKLVR